MNQKIAEFKQAEKALELNSQCLLKCDKEKVQMYVYLRERLLQKWEKLLSEMTDQELAEAWGYNLQKGA